VHHLPRPTKEVGGGWYGHRQSVLSGFTATDKKRRAGDSMATVSRSSPGLPVTEKEWRRKKGGVGSLERSLCPTKKGEIGQRMPWRNLPSTGRKLGCNACLKRGVNIQSLKSPKEATRDIPVMVESNRRFREQWYHRIEHASWVSLSLSLRGEILASA